MVRSGTDHFSVIWFQNILSFEEKSSEFKKRLKICLIHKYEALKVFRTPFIGSLPLTFTKCV